MILNKLKPLIDDVSKEIENHGTSVQNYSKYLYQYTKPKCAQGNYVFSLICDELSNITKINKAAFNSVSVIQSGPHKRLFLDDDYYPSLLFSLIGSNAAGKKINIIFNCSSITIDEGKNKGPGWLRVKDDVIKLSSLSRKKMAKTSLLFDTNNTMLSEKAKNRLSKTIPDLSINESYSSLYNAFDEINLQAFDYYHKMFGIKTIAVDEKFVSKILVKDLNSDHSFFKTFLTSGCAENIASELDAYDKREKTMVPKGTHFFWYKHKDKIQKTSLKDGYIVSYDKVINLKIDSGLTQLIKLIKDEILVPNLFVCFMFLSFLPRIKCLGGSYQIVYHNVFASLLYKSLKKYNLMPSSQEKFNSDLVSWGHNIISKQVLNHMDYAVHFEKASELTIEKSSNTYEAFFSDEKWSSIT